MGTVINSNYNEPRRFIENANKIILERVQSIMQRYNFIKINTIFNGEFVAGNKCANKTCHASSNPLLTSLEEFQQRDSLPSEDKWLSFGNHCRKKRILFVVYANLECALEKIDTRVRNQCPLTERYRHTAMHAVNVWQQFSKMYQPLPYADFRWVDDIQHFNFSTIAFQHFHDAHIDLSFCPTREKPPGKREDKILYKKFINIWQNHEECARSRLLMKWEGKYGAEAMIAKPNFHNRSVFSEVKFDKPIYVNMCILGISKTCLYEFHYEYTYDIMKRDINRFDTSDYAVDSAYSIPLANKKIPGLPGLIKDENNGTVMTEFGLKAKMYTLRIEGKKDTKKTKDDKSNVVVMSITFEDYRLAICELLLQRQKRKSFLHQIMTGKKHDKVILLYDNPIHHSDVAPSDYHLFWSMQHGLSEQHFSYFEDIKK
ncbi:hypothetical protein ALC56_13063 [Trachymyrmex septentrionalis]|uniref:Uncharacterized protein n=1 Tax=Trachymyrmex septentrionalis TaxID=34720 RepID=A0A195EXF4_9HYME|nr:hypothetical protein ALC56_13063 [Trachymyrmex septentrionalis]